ncbi:hypothetical protein [Actinomadura sp. 9N407]|uniref:hypothetical protein n=1 Tax=Actinomadura sp. 9N407 TaxID=3375154 RepID=UPI0037888A77
MARLSGFGLTLVPVWPYGFQRVEGRPDAVTVSHFGKDPARAVTVSADQKSFVLKDAESPEEVVDVLEGPDERVWRIETGPFTVRWPERFEISSQPAGDSTPFYLHGAKGALIYPQGPLHPAEVPADFTAPGQTVVHKESGSSVETIELTYRHDGAEWFQSHHLVPLGRRVLIITAQCPAADAATTLRAVETVARSVTVRNG